MGRRKLTGDEIRARDEARKARGKNADLGTLAHHCGGVGHIRRNVKKKLYLMCEECGMLHYNAPGGQAYLAAALGDVPPEPTPAPEPAPEPKPEPAPKTEPKPAPRASGFTMLDSF